MYIPNKLNKFNVLNKNYNYIYFTYIYFLCRIQNYSIFKDYNNTPAKILKFNNFVNFKDQIDFNKNYIEQITVSSYYKLDLLNNITIYCYNMYTQYNNNFDISILDTAIDISSLQLFPYEYQQPNQYYDDYTAWYSILIPNTIYFYRFGYDPEGQGGHSGGGAM